jgi:hypothetical protein
MATWEDGPEYAPVDRPTDFAVPDVPALEDVPPSQQPSANAPRDRPTFDGPSDPVPALASLEPAVEDTRDPQEPFDVVASTITSGTAWGAAHWSAPGQPTLSPAPPRTGTTTPETANGHGVPAAAPLQQPWPPPPAAVGPVSEYSSSGFPAPGTPEWFGPGPAAPRPPSADVGSLTRRVVQAVTPGVLICLGTGALLDLLAPVTLVLALALTTRVTVARERIFRAFLVCVGIISFFALVVALLTDYTFSEWWDYVGGWARIGSWVMAAVIVTTVVRELRRTPPRDDRQPWA